MGKILAGYLFPHPPIIIEEIGRGEETEVEKTIKACKELAKDIREKAPDTIIVVTPHGPLFSDAIALSIEEDLKGDFQDFGNKTLDFEYKNNLEITKKIIKKAYNDNIPIAEVDYEFAEHYDISVKLDHGTLVPLYFIEKEYSDFKLIHITYGLLSPKDLYRFGRIIQETVLESHEKVALIASGDLSHKLSDKGPYNYSPYGEEFDKRVVEFLRKGDFKSIVSFDLDLSERAGQCGLRSLMILAGFLDGFKIDAEVLSYEGPFGVGYCNAKFSVGTRLKGTEIYEDLIKDEKEQMDNIRKKEDEYVTLARKSLEYYIEHGKPMEVSKDIGEEFLNNRKGVFVTIKKDGVLRGCIGTIEPTQEILAKEIIENAISAGTKDPRFDQVTKEELGSLIYSVDVLNPPEPIKSIKDLDVERYGVIVTKGFKRGLLLPNLEGVDTEEEQVSIALRKAGIGENEDYRLERFEVIRHY
ncbi:MAG: AmmeMemoRadiSam system protein A [Tissierellia bacterium]|nr:AmmeMemoRadiSam system protein A [Tissierellia bacterium]